MKRPIAAALSLVLVACGAEPEQQTANADELSAPAATVTFDAGFGESLEGALVTGGSLTVDYDPARLGTCEGTQGGVLQWAVTGYRRDQGGAIRTFDVLSPNRPDGAPVTLALESAGTLELWFEATNRWGCHEWDSDYGANYRFDVGSPASYPAWAGDAKLAIARHDCGGGPCAEDLRSATDGFLFDSNARQRATVAHVYFQAYEPGLTDREEPRLWELLDAQVHYRFSTESEFESHYVDLDGRSGNNARYALPLRGLDPLGGNTVTDVAGCPAVELTTDGAYVRTSVEYYFTVSEVEVRPAPGETFTGVFEDHAGLYAPCLAE